VRAEVVEHDDEMLGGIALTHGLQQLLDLVPCLAVTEMAQECAVGRVVGGEQVTHPMGTLVRRPEAGRLLHPVPAPPQPRLQIEGAELIETEHPGSLGRARVRVEDPVLLGLELGVGRALPGLVVLEPNAGLVEHPPELAAADRRHDPGPHDVVPELGEAPGRERLTPVSGRA
jgi:hypothetical protein